MVELCGSFRYDAGTGDLPGPGHASRDCPAAWFLGSFGVFSTEDRARGWVPCVWAVSTARVPGSCGVHCAAAPALRRPRARALAHSRGKALRPALRRWEEGRLEGRSRP